MIPSIDFPAQMSNELAGRASHQDPPLAQLQRDDRHRHRHDDDDEIGQQDVDLARQQKPPDIVGEKREQQEDRLRDNYQDHDPTGELDDACLLPDKLVEKSVIIHKDENGFGLRFKGQCPVLVEHVHENGAAWRAGVRPYDTVSKVNGVPVGLLSHKDVILMFKSCARFVALTLLTPTTTTTTQNVGPTLADKLNSTAPNVRHRQSIGAGPCLPGGQEPGRSFDRTSSCNNSLRALAHQRLTAGGGGGGGPAAYNRARLTGGSTRSTLCATFGSIAQLELCRQLVRGQEHRCRTQSTTSSPGKQQPTRCLGRPCNDDSNDSSDSGHGRQASSGGGGDDKRLAVCVLCRSSVPEAPKEGAGPKRADGDDDDDGDEARRKFAQNLVCSQCQDKHASPAGSNHVPARQLQQMPPAAKDKRLGQVCKLSQSASTNSLPDQQHPLSSGRGGGGGSNTAAAAATAAATTTIGKLEPSATSSLISGSRDVPTQPSVFINKRVEIIREFIDTERTHTERLRCLDELFYRPLKQNGLMSHEQLRMVFSCHRTLYKIHRQIYRIMLSANYYHHQGQAAQQTATPLFVSLAEPMVGSALLEIFEGQFRRKLERAACSFCSAQATNIELLNKLTRRDTKVGEFLAQVTSQQMVGRLGIKDLLASCFQRLAKYPLLLENLLKATPEAPPPLTSDELAAYDQRELNPGGKLLLQNEDFPNDDPDSAFVGVAGNGDNDADYDCGDTNNGGHQDEAAGGECEEEDYEADEADEDEDERAQRLVQQQEEAARRLNSRRMLAISLAEEREFIERSLQQSRQILVRVNEAIRVAVSRHKLREIWKRTDKYPGVPLIDITKQQVVHEGLLTLRLSKRSFDVYVLLLNDYLIILTREGHDKYRLKFFTPEGKSSSAASAANNLVSSSSSSSAAAAAAAAGASSGASGATAGHHQSAGVYSPVFVIDEHLTTRDAATDENGFYLLCKRKDDSRIYEFASRSPAERMKWRDRIQWTIERQMSRTSRRGNASDQSSNHNHQQQQQHRTRRASCEGTLMAPNDTKAQARTPLNRTNESDTEDTNTKMIINSTAKQQRRQASPTEARMTTKIDEKQQTYDSDRSRGRQQDDNDDGEPTKFVGTISYVTEDEIVMPSRMGSYKIQVDQAIQVTNHTVI